MDINAIIDKLNTELDKLNNIKKQSIDTSSFFTDNEHFNDDFPLDNDKIYEKIETASVEYTSEISSTVSDNKTPKYEDIEPDNETTSLVTVKERGILAAQDMFKKSIRISLKSFLISITLSFLNLFI